MKPGDYVTIYSILPCHLQQQDTHAMKKFTIVCISDSGTRSWIYQITAVSAIHAHDHITARFPNYTVVAIFPDWHDEA